jgi:chromosome segregation ATPase
MNHEELLASVESLLGFRIQERENDAVLVRDNLKDSPKGLSGSRAVRPATGDEVKMFTTILGLSARLSEQTAAGEQAREIERQMGDALQAADARIKELMAANKGLGEEREFLAEVHAERIKAMQAKHDKALIAAAERMQAEWLKRFKEIEDKAEHAQERAESAEEMTSQMHAQLSTAEEKITELKAEVANMERAVLRAENATCDVHGNEEGKA